MRYLDTSCLLSSGGKYRYTLRRTWRENAHKEAQVLWVMLNPSTADGEKDDATIRRCVGFTDSWGYGALAVVNLCALRATDPRVLLATDINEATGLGNGNHIELLATDAATKLVVCAWGATADKSFALRGREAMVLWRFQELGIKPHCLAVTKSGSPAHPLRLSKKLKPVPYGS